MRALVAFAGVLLLGLSTAGHAKTIKTFEVGGWSAGAYTDEGKFSHCAGTAGYNSGIHVTVLIGRKYNWGVGFSNPAWRLTPGAEIPLAYVIDGGDVQQVTAKAISPTGVIVGFGGNSDRFQNFSRGRVLRIAASDQVFTFNLTDTSRLLPMLLNCVNEQVSPAPVRAAVTRPELRADAMVFAANLLSEAGVTGFRIATSNELPDIKADVVWVAGDVVGTVNVLPVILPRQIDELKALMVGTRAKECKGTFFSGSMPDDSGDSRLVRVFTTCQTDKTTTTDYYLVVPRKAGGYYMMRTMTEGKSETPAKEVDANIRKAVFKVLPK
ncbi:hypothetical protein JQ557_01030 [Bradyrhizobium sp. U87765 SZCCT0131]|uniref:hypothetical protein n=1 Tax=unclassified Bradyrhizobium TaxID=2631580 RepID=UPI001BA76DAC|nr:MULTISPECIES: hypothetical protein [unclassified Bradyrhizobium]MBR1216556.1 hypothetical protein [Bradyrhizobium sp. U87765 SZCCT0131]MBR1259688.1 hypothetical protein [Bradyrhizobium sp. U87765 SZCCT0134]MBR1305829.1 hypothetical protein [Bradyrhizobium sp. U87765 SZCCT0110]MBR1322196.1 hypothetical protein [Bradyrhizobium sp. U87765 SZCCT0109]MBR1350525.1 hypothetical protein [Bradyrhizobium sp. U87765 SZCCT0048]